MEEIRLQKYLADNGVASRRKCEEYITAGKVKVNGKIVKELGTKVNPKFDKVYFDGRIISPNQEEKIYILLNKPTGYVTTVTEQLGRKTVMDLIKDVNARVVPVRQVRYAYFWSFNIIK